MSSYLNIGGRFTVRKLARTFIPTLSIILALATIGVVFIASSGTAFAKATASPHSIAVTIPMKAMRYKGADSNVTGNCGDINLTVSNLGNGDAKFSEEVSSSQGFIFSLTYSLTWINHSKGISNSIGNSYLFPGNPWTHTDQLYTQPGFITAVLTATDHVGGVPPFGQDCEGSASGNATIS
jgi:hypothetical protein